MEGLGFTLHARHGRLGQTLSHARLPAWTSSAPSGDNLSGKAQADQLTRFRGARAAALLDYRSSKHFVGEFGKFPVFGRLDDMGAYARQVRAQSTVRDGFAHDRLPFAC
jgi:hypothetical protein